ATEGESGRQGPSCAPRMAPGVSGFNTPPMPATSHTFDIDLAVREIRWSASAPPSVPAAKHKAGHFVVGVLSFVFNALAITAMTGPAFLASLQPTKSQPSGTSVTLPSFKNVKPE